mgnify:CR=1 FL=1
MEISLQVKHKVSEALLAQRETFGGNDEQFARSYGLNPSVYSLLKHQKRLDENIIRPKKWAELAKRLLVKPGQKFLKPVRTEVFESIENDVLFCKLNGKSMMMVDEPEIGKTFTAQHLARTVKNCFYIDCSQNKTKSEFTRALASAIGVNKDGRFYEIKKAIKTALNDLQKPIVILDEAGDLSYTAFLDIKEFWNATENSCGWYMIGADGLRDKIQRGMSRQKVGYREIFSRFSSKYMQIVPTTRVKRQMWYKKLLTDVAVHNVEDRARIPVVVKKCLSHDANDGEDNKNLNSIGGLRRLETLLLFPDDEA